MASSWSVNPAAFHVGEIEIRILSGGRFRLDGGSMFGVVPKPLWDKVAPADELNRIQLDTNCILVKTPTRLALIDTGYGTRLNDKERQHNATEGHGLAASLAAAGISPDDVDVVVFSHLHFDHAGGATVVEEDGRVVPRFRNARYAAQRLEWEDAVSDAPEIAGTYLARDIRPLIEAGVDWRLDGDVEIVPGIKVERTGAHTPGHQIVWIESQGTKAAYLGDLCPTVHHLKRFWTMAYDQFPRDTRRIKPLVLSRLASENSIVLFDHEPITPAVRLECRTRHEFGVHSVVCSRNGQTHA